ncbi:hypothetical protein D030_0750B, partial [Vibrio parahaemolyticus AQ3810]
PSRSTSLRQG